MTNPEPETVEGEPLDVKVDFHRENNVDVCELQLGGATLTARCDWNVENPAADLEILHQALPVALQRVAAQLGSDDEEADRG